MRIIVLVCCVAFVRSFNLEPRIAILKEGPPNTYFGFSVSQHQILSRDRIESTILVGAPLDTYDGGGRGRYEATGVLYKCPFTSRTQDCVSVQDVPSNKDRRSLHEAAGQWLGVDVKSQGPGKQVIVCAHRYVKNETDQRWGHGQCFTLTQELKHSATWDPCQGREKNRAHEEWGYCQAGTSALLTEDQVALIGSPGPFTWRGTVFAVSVADDFLFRDKTHYYVPVKGGDAPVGKYSYLGMALAAGNFLPAARACGNQLVYAAGAPRAGGTGKVVIFSKCNSELMRVEKIIDGKEFASSFGYSLAAADINGDGFDDLFVGAPFFHQLFDEASDFGGGSFSGNFGGMGSGGGAVYVYLNSPDGLSSTPEVRLTGLSRKSSTESRFGFSIANAGDVNNDGLDDVIIGAPYDGRGKVFVYMGRKSKMSPIPDQIISAEDLPFKKLRTFGYSLSGGIDMDMNNFTDIVVGAYESDSVVVIRSRPVIDIETWFGKKPESIRPDLAGCEGDVYSPEVCFVIESCFLIKNFPPNIETTHIRYRLDAEIFSGGLGRKVSRIRFGDNRSNSSHSSEKIVAVERTSLTGCFQETAYMREGTTDIRTPVRFLLTLQLQQDEPRYLGADFGVANINQYPILNQREAHKELEIPFHKSCGGDDLCESKLQAFVEIVGQDRETGKLEIRDREEAVVRVTINNSGEPAYSAEMELKIDPAFSYVGRSDDAQDIHCDFLLTSQVGRIRCKLGNPYAQNRTSVLLFRVLPVASHVTERAIAFNVTVNTTSEDILPDNDRRVNLQVHLVRRAEVSIRSSVQPSRLWHGGPVMGESAMRALADIGPKVTHTFQVTNDGPWHVDEMEVVIQWPYQLSPPMGRKTGQGKWLLYLTDTPEITPAGAGRCFLNPRAINSLGLRERGLGAGRLGDAVTASAASDSAVKRRRRRGAQSRVDSDNEDEDEDYPDVDDEEVVDDDRAEYETGNSQHVPKNYNFEARSNHFYSVSSSSSTNSKDYSSTSYKYYSGSSGSKNKDNFEEDFSIKYVTTSSSVDFSESSVSNSDPISKNDEGSESNPIMENYSVTIDPSSGVVLDCSSELVQCHTFSCRLSNLRANESAVIRVRARVWNSTLVEEFPSAQLVVIQSRAKIVLPKLLNAHQSPDNDETLCQLSSEMGRTGGDGGGINDVPVWIILLSVAVGLTVVTLIAVTLYKLGFFRRNRLHDDVMISAKVTSSGYQRARTEDFIS